MRWGRSALEHRAPALAAISVALAIFGSPFLSPAGALACGVRAVVAGTIGILLYVRLRSAIARPLRTVANVVEAIRRSDFSLRGRETDGGALGELLGEVNELSHHLKLEQLRAVEATALLRSISERMDVALLAFDERERLELTNPAGERLFQPRPVPGMTAQALGIAGWLTGSANRAVSVPGQASKASWELQRGTFWRDGHRHVFVLLTDSRRVRREQERRAWQHLIRVISHEVNNTLAPIQSMACTSQMILRESPEDIEDVKTTLRIIEQRADALRRFILEYARLAKLPPPRMAPTRLRDCVAMAVAIEHRAAVRLVEGPDLVIQADGDQLEQALVNLIGNAVDASLPVGGATTVTWSATAEVAIITITDEGSGVQNPENLFVPFFSTKPNGSGVGLVLSRDIIERHGGELTIDNRSERAGCVVTVRLRVQGHDELTEERSSPG